MKYYKYAETILQAPIERTDDGMIITVQLNVFGPLTRKGLQRLRDYLALFDEGWFLDELEQPQPPTEPKREHEQERGGE